MILEGYILKGINKRKTREQLMAETGLSKAAFIEELAKLKQNKIVLFNEGYYLPSTHEEYVAFIEKCNGEVEKIKSLVKRAKEEEKEIW